VEVDRADAELERGTHVGDDLVGLKGDEGAARPGGHHARRREHDRRGAPKQL
jgi:hypothetical protein